jgi:hypothetical protein
MSKFVYEVIEETMSKKTRKEKIEHLRKYQSQALKDVLRGTFDETIVFELPKGNPPPFEKNDGYNAPANLLKEHKKFRYFVKGGVDNLLQIKRERLFLEMLEGVHPRDADLLINMINKQGPGGGITPKLVNEAFPGLIVSESS